MSVEESDGKGNGSEERGDISRLRSDMEKAINELKSEIEDLKNTLVELKASLGEMDNPFNLLTSLADEGTLKKAAETAQVKANEKEIAEPEKFGGEFQPLATGISEISGRDYNTSIALLKWVWTLLDLGFDMDDIERISKYCEFFGLLPKGSPHHIGAIASAVEKARALNLSEDVMALSIYGAAKASGAKIELENMTDIVFNALKKLIARPA